MCLEILLGMKRKTVISVQLMFSLRQFHNQFVWCPRENFAICQISPDCSTLHMKHPAHDICSRIVELILAKCMSTLKKLEANYFLDDNFLHKLAGFKVSYLRMRSFLLRHTVFLQKMFRVWQNSVLLPSCAILRNKVIPTNVPHYEVDIFGTFFLQNIVKKWIHLIQ